MELAGAASMAVFQSSAGRTVVVVGLVAAGAAHASSDASSSSLDTAGSGGCSSDVWSMARCAELKSADYVCGLIHLILLKLSMPTLVYWSGG